MKATRELMMMGLSILLVSLCRPAVAPGATYKIDPAHTSVSFGIRHLFTTVTGTFKSFEGRIVFDPGNATAAKVEGTIDTASIDTRVEKRDEHLRSADFFDVAKYPKITFVSMQVTDVGADKRTGKVHGNLTIRGITRPVVLEVEYLGAVKDPWGNTRAGFHATTTVNRKDFDLTWNKVLESGGMLVGEEVQITIDAEAILAEETAR